MFVCARVYMCENSIFFFAIFVVGSCFYYARETENRKLANAKKYSNSNFNFTYTTIDAQTHTYTFAMPNAVL